MCRLFFSCFFFFQAEDGIRDVAVTGVQTCALPISDFNVMVERFQNFGARDGFGGMVTMSLPFSFWTKPKYDAGVRAAAANQDAAKAAYEALKNQVLFEIKDLLAKMEAAG